MRGFESKKDPICFSTGNANFSRTFDFMFKTLPLLVADYFFSEIIKRKKNTDVLNVASEVVTVFKDLKNYFLFHVFRWPKRNTCTMRANETIESRNSKNVIGQHCHFVAPDRLCSSGRAFLLSPNAVSVSYAQLLRMCFRHGMWDELYLSYVS